MTDKFRNVVETWYNKIYLYELSETQKIKYLTDDTTLHMLCVDSLDGAHLIMDLENAYGIIITDAEAWDKGFEFMKFKDMCDWVESKPKSKYKKLI